MNQSGALQINTNLIVDLVWFGLQDEDRLESLKRFQSIHPHSKQSSSSKSDLSCSDFFGALCAATSITTSNISNPSIASVIPPLSPSQHSLFLQAISDAGRESIFQWILIHHDFGYLNQFEGECSDLSLNDCTFAACLKQISSASEFDLLDLFDAISMSLFHA
jgi:hypothetical protein